MKQKNSRRDSRLRLSSQAERGYLSSSLMRKPALSLTRVMSRGLRMIWSMLEEIFDESAYRRFLDRNRLESSANAYAKFREENDQAKSRRPRCC